MQDCVAEMAECPLVNALVAQYLAQVAPKVAQKFTKQMQVSIPYLPSSPSWIIPSFSPS